MIKEIQSFQNPLIKQFIQLHEKSRVRKKLGLFVVEGRREIRMALDGGFSIQTLLYCEALAGLTFVAELDIPDSHFVKITADVYQKLAIRGSSEGVLAIFHTKTQHLDDLSIERKNPLILVAEAPEKPGNIGALLRTADAANLDAVLLANLKTDIYNPNIIRSSIGCVFTNQIAIGSTTEIISFLQGHSIKIYCAALSASKSYELIDYTPPSAIVMGTEATGLSNDWLQSSDQNIIIPMQGKIDSMNVSVSAGILIFEAKRQRNFDL